MNSRLLVVVDVGATTVRAGVYDLDGRCHAIRTRSVDVKQAKPGATDVNATAYYDAAAMVARRAVRAASGVGQDVMAIALACQMGGIVGIDEAGKAVTRFDPHFDDRCQPIRERLMREHEGTVRGLTGCLPYMCAKIEWWQENEAETAARVRKWVTLGGYLAARMAGLDASAAFIDRSNLGLTGLADNAAGAWSIQLIELCGISPDVLPRVVPSGEIVGELSGQAAEDFKMKSGVPVIAGLGDYPATFLGAGLTRRGMVCDLSANICHFAASMDHFAADETYRALSTFASHSSDLWYAMAYTHAGGNTCRWFLEDIGGFQERAEMPERIRQLEDEATKLVPGADGLLFIPYLNGRQCPWDAAMRGAWLGLRSRHNQTHMHRSMLESVAFEYAYFLQVVREISQRADFEEIHGIGPGVRSRLWVQIKADVLGIPYVVHGRDDHAMLGAAAVAAASVGAVANEAEAVERWLTRTTRIEPDRDRHRQYTELFQLYLRALSDLRPFFAELRETARRFAAVPQPAMA